jgi:transcriptional regulator with PAS, ATPase and Fis domain
MPPLVGHLIDRFLQNINQRRTQPLIFPDRLRQILADYSFPGNIRESLNIVQRVSVFLEAGENVDTILTDLLVPIDVPGSEGQDDLRFGATLDLKSEVRKFERALIDKAIRIHGSKRKAAIALGTTIGTVVRKTTEDSEESQA